MYRARFALACDCVVDRDYIFQGRNLYSLDLKTFVPDFLDKGFVPFLNLGGKPQVAFKICKAELAVNWLCRLLRICYGGLVVPILPLDYVEHFLGQVQIFGKDSDYIQRRCICHKAIPGNSAVGWLKPVYTAEGGRLAD